jgi:hypothetical protein
VAIVNSTHAVGHLQVDGRRYVVERHTDSTGAVHVREYLAGDVDYTAIRDARAVALSAELAENEVTQVTE